MLITRAVIILLLISTAISLCAQRSICQYQVNGIDLQTRQYQIIGSPSHAFNYTPPDLKNNLQQDNLIETSTYLMDISDEMALVLSVTINSLKSQEIYGKIEPGNILKAILLNGKEVQLTCSSGSLGTFDKENKSYTYQVVYTLEKSDVRNLSKKEVDKIGIQWSSGYEEYPIYEVDFLMNQIACLKKAQQARQN